MPTLGLQCSLMYRKLSPVVMPLDFLLRKVECVQQYFHRLTLKNQHPPPQVHLRLKYYWFFHLSTAHRDILLPSF